MENKNFELELMARYGYNKDEYAEFDEKILDKLITSAYNEDKGYKIVNYIDKDTYNNFLEEFIDDIQFDIKYGTYKDNDPTRLSRYWEELNEYVYQGNGLQIISDNSQDWLLISNADAQFTRDVVSKEDTKQINKLTHNFQRLDYNEFDKELDVAVEKIKQSLNTYTTMPPQSFSTRKELEEAINNLDYEEVKNIDLSNWDVSNITDMSLIFETTSFEKIKGIENWDISNVVDMSGMFENCYNLQKIDGLENWNTSKVKDMAAMFYNCYELEELDLTGWDTSKVTAVHNMFYKCFNLKEIKGLDKADLSKVKTHEDMFSHCPMEQVFDLDGELLIKQPKTKTKMSY